MNHMSEDIMTEVNQMIENSLDDMINEDALRNVIGLYRQRVIVMRRDESI